MDKEIAKSGDDTVVPSLPQGPCGCSWARQWGDIPAAIPYHRHCLPIEGFCFSRCPEEVTIKSGWKRELAGARRPVKHQSLYTKVGLDETLVLITYKGL